MDVVLDTSALIAITNKTDQWHKRAKRLLHYLRHEYEPRFIVPTIVRIELFGHLTRARGLDKRRRCELLDEIDALQFTHVYHSPDDLARADQHWRKFADWPVDYCDALVVVTAVRLNAKNIWLHDEIMTNFIRHHAPELTLFGVDQIN